MLNLTVDCENISILGPDLWKNMKSVKRPPKLMFKGFYKFVRRFRKPKYGGKISSNAGKLHKKVCNQQLFILLTAKICRNCDACILHNNGNCKKMMNDFLLFL